MLPSHSSYQQLLFIGLDFLSFFSPYFYSPASWWGYREWNRHATIYQTPTGGLGNSTSKNFPPLSCKSRCGVAGQQWGVEGRKGARFEFGCTSHLRQNPGELTFRSGAAWRTLKSDPPPVQHLWWALPPGQQALGNIKCIIPQIYPSEEPFPWWVTQDL